MSSLAEVIGATWGFAEMSKVARPPAEMIEAWAELKVPLGI